MTVRYPNSVLMQPTQKVDFDRDEVKRLSEDMFATLEKERGVGLAANQFSELTGLSMFVVNFKDKEDLFTGVFVNPEIVSHSDDTTTVPEMCLSLPSVKINKERYSSITLRWQDVEAKEHEETFVGFKAVILQHEMDHLFGKTILSSLPRLKQKIVVDQMKKNVVKSVRARAKEMNIPTPKNAQEKIDIYTGKRMWNE